MGGLRSAPGVPGRPERGPILNEHRPVLGSWFAGAWQARRAVEQFAVSEDEEPPPPGISEDYTEWDQRFGNADVDHVALDLVG